MYTSELTQIPPNTLCLPVTQWSLLNLKEAAEQKALRNLGIETIRVILDETEITITDVMGSLTAGRTGLKRRHLGPKHEAQTGKHRGQVAACDAL